MDRLFEERAGGCGVAVVAKADIDYLAMLVDRSEQVAPAPAQRGTLRPGRFDEAWGEGANPIIDRALGSTSTRRSANHSQTSA
jgi:hypothetical protein